MREIRFSDLSCDFAVLDRFNQISGYRLVDLEDGHYTINDLQLMENLDLNENFYSILDIWYNKAKTFYEESYLDNIGKYADDTDKLRAETYLKELEIIKRVWLVRGTEHYGSN